MYSAIMEIYHDDVHTAWFSNHLIKACALFILVEAPPFSKLETKNPVPEHFFPRLALPRVLSSLLAGTHQTQPVATSSGSRVSFHHAAALPGHPAQHQRQVGLIAGLPSCFEWCFSPSLFRCRDSLPWTGGDDLQAHYA